MDMCDFCDETVAAGDVDTAATYRSMAARVGAAATALGAFCVGPDVRSLRARGDERAVAFADLVETVGTAAQDWQRFTESLTPTEGEEV